MSKEIFLPHGTTGLTTLYAAIRRPSDGFWWYTVTPAFEAFNSGHVAAGYAVAMTEEGTSGNYYADFPAGVTAAGRYEVTARKRAGGSPAWPADAVVGTQSDFDWSGSAVVVPYAGADTAGTTSLLALAGGGSGFAAIKGDTAAIKARTDALPTAPADETLVISATNAIMARLGAPAAASIAADIATRSTYAGGVVAGVTAPVTVGANNDKAGYSLAPAGLDAVTVDSGHNLRQVAALDHAVLCGTVSGQDANAPVFKSGGGSTTRVSAATDANGNRTSVTLAPPA